MERIHSPYARAPVELILFKSASCLQARSQGTAEENPWHPATRGQTWAQYSSAGVPSASFSAHPALAIKPTHTAITQRLN